MVIKIERGKMNLSETGIVIDGTTNVEYIFSNVDNVQLRSSTPSLNLNVMGQDSEDSTSMNLQGKSFNISFDFQIYNDGVDRSNGTFGRDGTFGTGAILSIDDQVKFLKSFHTGKFDRQYYLTINNVLISLCSIEDLNITLTFNKPNSYHCSIQLVEGKNSFSV